MISETESYRPFFNRRVSPAIRELLANRQAFLADAASLARRRFGGRPVPPEINVPAGRSGVSAFTTTFSSGAFSRQR